VIVKGLVKVHKSPDGSVRNVRIRPVNEFGVKVMLDEAGLKVAKEEGKTVEVSGVKTVKDGLPYFIVKSYKVVEEAKPEEKK